MTRIVFRDFDEFTDSLGGMVGRVIPTARSTEAWSIQTAAIGRMLAQSFQVGSAVTFSGDGKRDEVALHIPLTDPIKIRIDGQSLAQNSFLLIRHGLPFTLSTTAATRWAGIVVPSDHLLVAADFMPSLASLLYDRRTIAGAVVGVNHLDNLRLLASRLSGAAENVAFDAAALRRIEEQILASASHALQAGGTARPRHIGRPSLSRGTAIAKVLELVDASEGARLCIHDLCGAAGVAERTLRNFFHEYFGIAPMRLLKLRQLGAIRAALFAAATGEKVNSIATAFGISDFSLFGHNYKALFGESPSHTLRTAAKRAQHDVTARNSWLHYAGRAARRMADEIENREREIALATDTAVSRFNLNVTARSAADAE